MQAIGLSNIKNVKVEGQASPSAVGIDDTEKSLFASELNKEIEQVESVVDEEVSLENMTGDEIVNIVDKKTKKSLKATKENNITTLLNSNKSEISEEPLASKSETALLENEESPVLEKGTQDKEISNLLIKNNPELTKRDTTELSKLKGEVKLPEDGKEISSVLKESKVKKDDVASNKLDPSFSSRKENIIQEKVSKERPTLVLGQDFIKNKKLLKSNKEKGILDAFKGKKKHLAFGSYQKEANVLENKIITNKGIESVLNQKEALREPTGQRVQDILSTSENTNIDQMIGDISSSGTNELEVADVTKTKVSINMSDIKASNQSEVISKITDYLHQNNIESRDNLEVLVDHNDLGQFNINVKKTALKGVSGKQVDIEIITNSDVGHEFFARNEAELVKSLNSSGLKLASIKITGSESLAASTSAGGKDFGQSSDNQNTNENLKQQFSSKDQSNGQQRDSKRRKDMWNYYQQQAA